MLTEQKEIELLENVKSLTDHMHLVDEVFKQMRVGRNMVLAFQCGHSGLYLPGDYVKNWGRGYGIGLGPNPVSEVLDSDYHTKPAPISDDMDSIDQIMHPVGNSFAQVDYMLVEEEALLLNSAILAKDDGGMRKRIPILRKNQMKNPLSKIAIARAMWTQAKGVA